MQRDLSIHSVKVKEEPPDIPQIEVKRETQNMWCDVNVPSSYNVNRKSDSIDVMKGVEDLKDVLKQTLVPANISTGVTNRDAIPDLSKVKLESVSENDSGTLKGIVSNSEKEENYQSQNEKVAPNVDYDNVQSINKENTMEEVERDDLQQSDVWKSVLELLKHLGYEEKATKENVQWIVHSLMNGLLPSEEELESLFNPTIETSELSSSNCKVEKKLDNSGENKASRSDDKEMETSSSTKSGTSKLDRKNGVKDDSLFPSHLSHCDDSDYSEKGIELSSSNCKVQKKLSDSGENTSEKEASGSNDTQKNTSSSTKGRGTYRLGKKKGVKAKDVTHNSRLSHDDDDTDDPEKSIDVSPTPNTRGYSLRNKVKKNLAEESLSPIDFYLSDDSDEWTPEKTKKKDRLSYLSTLRKRSNLRWNVGHLSKKKKKTAIGNDSGSNEQSHKNSIKRKVGDSEDSEDSRTNKLIVPKRKGNAVEREKNPGQKLMNDQFVIEKNMEENQKKLCIKKSQYVTTQSTMQEKDGSQGSPSTNVTTDVETMTISKEGHSVPKTQTKTITSTENIIKVPNVSSPSTSKTASKSSDGNMSTLDDVYGCTKCLMAFVQKQMLHRHMFRFHYDDYVRLKEENFWAGLTL